MDFITKIFDLDLSAFVPEMPAFLGGIRALLVILQLLGPILLAGFGALYLFKPAPEANYRYGFKTYYGMGSIEAWQFSQRIAGMIFGGLGAVFLLAMTIVALTFIGKDLFRIAGTVIICLLIQAVFTLAARITIAVLCRKYFDKDGNHRR